jgi:hypothetical protein
MFHDAIEAEDLGNMVSQFTRAADPDPRLGVTPNPMTD